MPYNLLVERWIPVRRRSGSIDWIAPHQIAERDDPPIAIASPRPDFDGALIQFLIGLVQTTAAPKDERAWKKRYETPHDPDELRGLFATVEPAFNLDGDGPRFMQDLTLAGESHQVWDIADLLIGTPGENTIKNNFDLFEKRGRVSALSYEASAMALLTMQLNSPEGGGGAAGGHNVSIRGGGPLTTLAVGSDLYETTWLNVIEKDIFESKYGNGSRQEPGAVFPWQGNTRSSDKALGGVPTTPEDVHPLHQFWAMPRRIRLVIEADRLGNCDITGRRDLPVVSTCVTTHSGFKYSVGFRHPLSPYRREKGKEEWRAIRGHSASVAYSSWPTNVLPGSDTAPARAISRALSRMPGVPRRVSLAAFGFETKQEKVRSWHQCVTPLVGVETELQDAFRSVLEGFVAASENVRKTLFGKIKEALARRPQDLPGDLGATVNAAFWAATEPAFFAAVIAVRDALGAGPPPPAIAEQWLAALHAAAKELFETYSQMRGEFSATEVRRVATAWNELVRYTSPGSFKLREAVGLAPRETVTPGKKRARKVNKEVTT